MHGWSHDMAPWELGEPDGPRCCDCRSLVTEEEEVVVNGDILCSECAFEVLGPLKLAGVREVGRLRVERALDALVQS